MRTNMLPIQNRLRTLASAAVAITLFVLPAGAAFARGGHGGGGRGGGQGGFHGGAAHASVARSGFAPGGMRAGGISRGGFARGQFANSGRYNFAAGRGVRSFRGSSGRQFALRNSQRYGNVRGRNGVFFNGNRNFYGYPYGYGSYYGGYGYRSYYGGYGYGSYYYNVCNPYSVYYDPYYCQQLYYGGY
jgi:hypothetical protein